MAITAVTSCNIHPVPVSPINSMIFATPVFMKSFQVKAITNANAPAMAIPICAFTLFLNSVACCIAFIKMRFTYCVNKFSVSNL